MAFRAPILVGSRLQHRRWQLVAVVILAVLLQVAVSGLAAGFGSRPVDALRVYFTALVAATVLTLPGLAVVAWLDRREPESPWLYLFAIAWGSIGAGGLALVLNAVAGSAVLDALRGDPVAGVQSVQLGGGMDPARYLVAVLVGPPIEELVKAIAIILLAFFLRGHFQTMRDGIVFGLLVGFGFTLIEAPFYVMKGYLDDGQAPWMQQLVGRYAFFALSGHGLYSALVGAGVGLAVQRGRTGWRSAALLGLAAGTVAHMANNALAGIAIGLFLVAVGALDTGASSGAEALAAVPPVTYWLGIVVTTLVIQSWSIVLLAVLLVRSARFERATIREQLRPGIGTIITPEEYAELEAEPLLGLRTIPGETRARSRAIVTAQNKLALGRWRAAQDGRDPDTDPIVEAWAEELARLRADAGGS